MHALAERVKIGPLAQFRPVTRQEVNRTSRKAATTNAGPTNTTGGGKISQKPSGLPLRAHHHHHQQQQPAVLRGQGEQPEQSDGDGLGATLSCAISKKSSPTLDRDVGDECHVRNPQQQQKPQPEQHASVTGRGTATVTDTHRARKYVVQAGDDRGRLVVRLARRRSLRSNARSTSSSMSLS